MDRVTRAFLSFHSFDMNSFSPKFSFYIFSTFKMAGTSNSIVIKSWSKMESFNFPGLQHILLQVFFSFSGFQKLERDVAEYITNFPHHTTKSRSQTCHKVRNNQKTYQFEGFRKIFGRFYKFWTGNAESLTNIWMMKVSTYSCLSFQFLEIWKK